MDIYNAHAAWLNPTNPSAAPTTTDPTSVQQSQHDHWKDSNPSAVNGHHLQQQQQQQQQQQPSLDLAFLDDLPTGKRDDNNQSSVSCALSDVFPWTLGSSSGSPTSMANNPFYPFLQMAAAPQPHFSPYATPAAWGASPTHHLPLSNYSTLNGATSPPPAQLHQQPTPTTPQSMVIECVVSNFIPQVLMLTPHSQSTIDHNIASSLRHTTQHV
jgi:hypothetical protein